MMKRSVCVLLILITNNCIGQVEEIIVESLRFKKSDSTIIEFSVTFSKDVNYLGDLSNLVCPFMCSDNYRFNSTEAVDKKFLINEGIYVEESVGQYVCASTLIPSTIKDELFCDGFSGFDMGMNYKKNNVYKLYLRTTHPVYEYFKNRNFIVVMMTYHERMLFCSHHVYKILKDKTN
jgi:hypothetical protein